MQQEQSYLAKTNQLDQALQTKEQLLSQQLAALSDKDKLLHEKDG